jgi:hypothetical protein
MAISVEATASSTLAGSRSTTSPSAARSEKNDRPKSPRAALQANAPNW